MTILNFIILCVVVGFLLWLVPMDDRIKTVLVGAVVLILLVILLNAMGLFVWLNQPIPHISR